MVDQLKEAAEVYEHGRCLSCINVVRQLNFWMIVRLADSTLNEAKMKLAEIYEILNEPRKALDLVYEGLFPFLSFALWQTSIFVSSNRLPEETTKGRELYLSSQWSTQHRSYNVAL